MMAKRIGTRQTGRETAERTRGETEQRPRKRRPRSPTPRPKRDVRSQAERAGVTSATSEAGVAPAGQSGSRDDAPLRGAAAGDQPSPSNSGSPSQPGWCPNPGGVRLSLGALTIDAERPEVERGALKAVVSVRRGDELLYRDRVNLDWSGGRDKFLRKASRRWRRPASRLVSMKLSWLRCAPPSEGGWHPQETLSAPGASPFPA